MQEMTETRSELEPIVRWVTQFVTERDITFVELNEVGCPPVAALAYISFLMAGSISILRQDLNDEDALAAVRVVGASTFNGPLGDRLFKPDDGPREPRFRDDLETIAAFRDRCKDSPVEEAAEIFMVILSGQEGQDMPNENIYPALVAVGKRFFTGARDAIEEGRQQLLAISLPN